MWDDAMNAPVSRTIFADPQPPGRTYPELTGEFRLLGKRPVKSTLSGERAMSREGNHQSNYAAPYRMDQAALSTLSGNAWQFAPQFALYSEVEGWLPLEEQSPANRRSILVRLSRWLRNLVVPVTLGLVAFGLIAIVTTPVLARTVRNSSGAGLRVNGYWEQAATTGSASAVPPVPSVPVIEARSDALAPASLQVQPGVAPYDVVGSPSLSVDQIERVLLQYGSPAAGQGKLLYDLGVRYSIDPAYALAFFVHESGCGTKGVARFTRSLGNIRWTEGFENYNGYRKYPTWAAGMEDWYKLITELYIGAWNLRTVDQIIPVYAPWGDNNNPPAYIRSIKLMVDSWRGK